MARKSRQKSDFSEYTYSDVEDEQEARSFTTILSRTPSRTPSSIASILREEWTGETATRQHSFSDRNRLRSLSEGDIPNNQTPLKPQRGPVSFLSDVVSSLFKFVSGILNPCEEPQADTEEIHENATEIVINKELICMRSSNHSVCVKRESDKYIVLELETENTEKKRSIRKEYINKRLGVTVYHQPAHSIYVGSEPVTGSVKVVMNYVKKLGFAQIITSGAQVYRTYCINDLTFLRTQSSDGVIWVGTPYQPTQGGQKSQRDSSRSSRLSFDFSDESLEKEPDEPENTADVVQIVFCDSNQGHRFKTVVETLKTTFNPHILNVFPCAPGLQCSNNMPFSIPDFLTTTDQNPEIINYMDPSLLPQSYIVPCSPKSKVQPFPVYSPKYEEAYFLSTETPTPVTEEKLSSSAFILPSHQASFNQSAQNNYSSIYESVDFITNKGSVYLPENRAHLQNEAPFDANLCGVTNHNIYSFQKQGLYREQLPCTNQNPCQNHSSWQNQIPSNLVQEQQYISPKRSPHSKLRKRSASHNHNFLHNQNSSHIIQNAHRLPNKNIYNLMEEIICGNLNPHDLATQVKFDDEQEAFSSSSNITENSNLSQMTDIDCNSIDNCISFIPQYVNTDWTLFHPRQFSKPRFKFVSNSYSMSYDEKQ